MDFGTTALVFALWSFPTLAEVNEKEPVRPFTFSRFFLRNKSLLRQNFMFNKRSVEQSGRYWTVVSHAFLHQDLEHLVYNISALLGPSISPRGL